MLRSSAPASLPMQKSAHRLFDAGTCWAFSATENIESVWALAGNALTPLSGSALVVLRAYPMNFTFTSVEQIVDCDSTKDPLHDRADCSVFGGWPYLAFQ